MIGPPDSTRRNLSARLNQHVRTTWPGLAGVELRCRANFVYVDVRITGATVIKRWRLRYGGSAHLWGFSMYRASHDDYEDSYLPTGSPAGTAADALDCAGMLYLNDFLPWSPDPLRNC